MSYDYDLFISYRRTEYVTGWVRNHLAPVLQSCLDAEMARPPQVFVDNQLESGDYWPETLSSVLARTRYLLAVWTPQYFTSKWCMAEWTSMLARERMLGIPSPEQTRGLVYPVLYSGRPSTFPDAAQAVQVRQDLTGLGAPFRQFRDTEVYIEFYTIVRSIAEELAARFDEAPEWQAGWPVERPDAFEQPVAQIPRLGV